MAVCTFDNPATYRRECWQNEELLYAYSATILPDVARVPIPREFFFFGANVGPWSPGKIWGDRAAIKSAEKEEAP